MKIKRCFLILAGVCIAFSAVSQGRAQVIAHRGYWQSRGAAQNSVMALENAERLGVYGAEFDVHQTADGVLVVHHDGDIKGVSIQQSPYAAIMDSVLSNGEKIPTLREYLEAAKRTEHIRLIFELKPHATPERSREAARASVDLVREKKLQHRTDYITFDLEAGKELIRLSPDAEVYYLSGNLSPEELKTLGFAGLDYHFDVMRKNPQWFREAKRLGLGVNVWTVNDTTVIRAMTEQGADFITTDIPDEALKFISSSDK